MLAWQQLTSAEERVTETRKNYPMADEPQNDKPLTTTPDYKPSRYEGTALGTFSGAAIGIGAGCLFSVFDWEMASLVVFVFAAAGGLISGAVATRHGFIFGGLAGSSTFGVLFVVLAMNASLPPDNPSGIPIWGTVTVVVASFAAAMTVWGYFQTMHALPQKTRLMISRTIAALIALVALVLIVMFLMTQLR